MATQSLLPRQACKQAASVAELPLMLTTRSCSSPGLPHFFPFIEGSGFIAMVLVVVGLVMGVVVGVVMFGGATGFDSCLLLLSELLTGFGVVVMTSGQKKMMTTMTCRP